MELLLDHFPVFEANQVLTSGHLNDVFDYLDQQERLTRSHLIGIGIVCGLEFKLDTSAGTAIKLAKGCGVTSEGYLIIEPADVSLVSYRTYTLPIDLDYPPFKDGAQNPYPMWEMFAAGEPNTTLLSSPAIFLDDKAFLLFLELRKQGLRNCSPNNCDDKGSEVTATVRRLLVKRSDLDKIIAAANALGGGLTSTDIDAALSARLNLPDLHIRRFDVPNTNPVTANDVYAAFLNVTRGPGLVNATGNALSAAYTAFEPLLKTAHPANPFTNFKATFGFLDTAPTTTAQVKFLQYYVDLFDDLLRAYDEFRWKGAELICACCPPDGLFPRHLMLGLVHPESVSQPANYRHGFLASPAVGDCANETKALLQLFARLVELAARFTNAPTLPGPDPKAPIDPQIRITPSVLGDRPLSEKAIPYYYTQSGTPPLFKLWNVERSRRNRANQNLGYRSDEYSPIAPAFVTDPLRYDIEPYNFLRVEGHLGKDYQRVLGSLLSAITKYRLPFDVIALRTGTYDDTQPVDLTKETARFQDLEALYDSLREELMASLAEGAMELYGTLVEGLKLPAGKPKLELLKKYAPNYGYPANSVGAWYEKYLNVFVARPYIDVDQDKVDVNAVFMVYCQLFTGTTGLAFANFAHAVAVYYIMKLSQILPDSLDALGYADFENKYEDLLELLRYFRSDTMANLSADLKAFIPQEEFIDLCEEILFDCKLNAVKAVHDEYVRRIGELRKRQFLVNFLALHPGIQHKAGVPLGGTFIVVYHDEPEPKPVTDTIIGLNAELIAMDMTLEAAATGSVVADTTANAAPMMEMASFRSAPADSMPGARTTNIEVVEAINRINTNRALLENADVNILIGSLTGRVPVFTAGGPSGPVDAAAKVIATAVGELADGTVIADFFLPYRVSSDCPGVQYVLPKQAATFSASVGCANSDGFAAVTIEAKGGVAPYDVSVDQGVFQALSGPLQLGTGAHSLVLRDAEGTETSEKSVTVAPTLVVGQPDFSCAEGKFTATASITGGTPPYMVDGKAVANDSFTTDPVASGATLSVTVTDANSCTAKATFTHTCPPPCTLPCAGISLRRGYRFWIPDVDPSNPYKIFKLNGASFEVESAPGNAVDLSPKIKPILVAKASDLTPAGFPNLVKRWTEEINKVIESEPSLNEPGKAQWLTLTYEPAGAGRLGMLWLDHFECLSFAIKLDLSFTRSGLREDLVVTYRPDDTRILLGDLTTTVPAFNGTKTDKCSANPVPEPLCPEAPSFGLGISPTQVGREPTSVVAVTPPTPDLAFVWEVQDAIPPMGNGPTFKTRFTSFGSKLVTVTAFTKAGCTRTFSAQVQVFGIT